MKEKIILGVSLLFGIAALLLTTQFLKSKEANFNKRIAEIYAGATKIMAVTAKQDIPAGTVITTRDIVEKNIFKSAAGSLAITRKNYKDILGKKTSHSIKKGDVLNWSLIEGGLPSSGGLSERITPGLRAISISVGGAAAVSGMVQPKDSVDVLGTFSFPSQDIPGQMETVTLSVLQDVTILATGQKMARATLGQRNSRSSNSGYNTVTLEVTPREAELLVFAQKMKGSLTLALRHPTDVTWKRNLPSVNFDLLQNELPAINLERQRNIRHKKDI